MYVQFISCAQGLYVFLYIISVIFASYIEVKKIQEAVLDGYDLVVRPADGNGSLNVFLQLKIQKLVKLVRYVSAVLLSVTIGTKYSRMDQVKFVEDSL